MDSVNGKKLIWIFFKIVHLSRLFQLFDQIIGHGVCRQKFPKYRVIRLNIILQSFDIIVKSRLNRVIWVFGNLQEIVVESRFRLFKMAHLT